MKKIEKLTKDQEAKIPEYRERWLAIGLSTQETDKKQAEEGVRLAYSKAGLKCPDKIVWEPSPCAGAKRAADLLGKKKIEEVLSMCGYGQHDASWLGYYEFFKEVVGIDFCSKLDGLNMIAKAAGWWWPMDEAVVMTERHHTLKRDANGRLHSEDTAALQYPDGWGIWAWHGVRVPQRVIEQPDTLTVKEIEAEQNAEVRRVMVTKFGQARYIQESGAELVHEDEWGKLYKKAQKNDEDMMMVHVVNSTPEGRWLDKFDAIKQGLESEIYHTRGEKVYVPVKKEGKLDHKDYWLRVPPTIRTARAGVAWTFNRDESEAYQPEVQT